jgi:DinB superfamily/Pentapeptide repeats (8 copies)
MADFIGADLRGSRFERVDLGGAEFRAVDLAHATFRGVDMCSVVMRGVELGNVDIRGEIDNLTINGVDIGPLVDGEWSFIETLRHLVFATDSWIGRVILGDPSPWDPLGLPWDEMPDTPGVPRDRDARPSLGAVLELRNERMATVRRIIDDLTDEALDGHTEPVEGPGWPPPRSFPVRECLLVILNEEWEHRLYAERDLDALAASKA